MGIPTVPMKPCRFCGGETVYTTEKPQAAPPYRCAAFCITCGAQGPQQPTDDAAVAAWNGMIPKV